MKSIFFFVAIDFVQWSEMRLQPDGVVKTSTSRASANQPSLDPTGLIRQNAPHLQQQLIRLFPSLSLSSPSSHPGLKISKQQGRCGLSELAQSSRIEMKNECTDHMLDGPWATSTILTQSLDCFSFFFFFFPSNMFALIA